MSGSRSIFRRSVLLWVALISLSAPSIGNTGLPKPAGLIPNIGQWPSEVLFLHRERNLDVWITKSGLVLNERDRTEDGLRGQIVRYTWTGATTPEVVAVQENSALPVVNVLTGNDPSRWTRGARVCTGVTLRGIYPGVDVVYYLDNGKLRYDIHAQPGADVSRISVAVEGADNLTVLPGRISAKTRGGELVVTDLAAFIPGTVRKQVPATFAPTYSGFRFVVDESYKGKPVVIDPLVYGTYLGGQGADQTTTIQYTAAGVLVGGWTEGMAFPTGTGRYQSAKSGDLDGFIALMTKDLKRVVAYTYFGGSGADKIAHLTTDNTGNVFAVGTTTSNDLPVTSGAAVQTYRAQIDAFVVKLTQNLSKLDVCTYIGGNRDELATAIAVDANGNMFVAGGTNSTTGFPTNLGHQKTLGGQWDGFLCKLTPNGSSFVFSTYFGREGVETFTALALNSSGEPHITGSTTSSNFETAPTPGRWASGRVPYDRTYNGGNTDAFVVKFFADGSLSKSDDGTYSTYFGGNGDEIGRGIFIDQTGRAVVVGTTTSTNLPVTAGIKSAAIGGKDIFMAVLSDDGRSLASATYYGGTGNDEILGATNLGATATAVIFGTTTSNDFPIVSAGAGGERAGPTDGFIAIINTSAALMSTYIAGDAADSVVAASVDNNGDVYYAMSSGSLDLSLSDTAYQATPAGGTDGYIGKYAAGVMNLQAPAGGEALCQGTNFTISWGAEEMLASDRYKIEHSTDAGSTWRTIANDVNSRNYTWRPDSTAGTGTTNRIRVSTARGHISISGNFAIVKPPTIKEQPADAEVCADARVELTVAAEGASLRYQWRKAGQNISGATQPTYVIPSVTSASSGNYDVVVSGTCNPSATSRSVKVGVTAPTSITTQPAGATTEEGKSFTLTVAASGTALAYQWKKDGAPISGATKGTYTIASAALSDAGTYVCEVSGGCGKATSNEAVVVVTPATSVAEDRIDNGTWCRILGPTPASWEVQIALADSRGAHYSARVLTVRGEQVARFDVGAVSGETRIRVPLENLGSGTYLIELRSETAIMRLPFVIQQ